MGEEIAARALVRAGWTVLGRNVRAPEGELDVVARDGEVLVVVEVKTSAADAGGRWRPADHVRPRDVMRRARAARRIAEGGRSRMDVVEVELAPGHARAAGGAAHRACRDGPRLVHHRGVTPGAPLALRGSGAGDAAASPAERTAPPRNGAG
ncbi:MAG: YraN family protein [Planctomycetota bacterium]